MYAGLPVDGAGNAASEESESIMNLDGSKLKGTYSAIVCLLVVLTLCDTYAQDSGMRGPMGEIPGHDPTVAQDPLGSRPPPADDPNEPDVGKRPRFLWELGQQRIPLASGTIIAMELFRNYEQWKDRRIPDERKQQILTDAQRLLQADFLPQTQELVRWYGMWGSVPVFDASQNIVSRKSSLNWALAEWDVGDYQIRTGSGLRIRLPRRPELEFRPMPSGFKGSSRDWDYVSNEGLRTVLDEFLAIPFDEYDEFWVRGYIESLAGVDVFVGKFGLRNVPKEPDDVARSEPLGSWGRTHRILITDSDPQYLCVSFDLRAESGNAVEYP